LQSYHNAVRLGDARCSGIGQGLDQKHSKAGLTDEGWGDKRNVINSWDSCAADSELYESCSEQDFRIHAQDEYAGLPSFNFFNASIESGCIRYSGCSHGTDGNNRDLLIGRAYYRSRVLLSSTVHGRERATKHDHQAQGEKDFADDCCFHIIYSMVCCVHLRNLDNGSVLRVALQKLRACYPLMRSGW